MTTQASIPLKWYVPFATGDASRVEIPVTSSDATRASQTLGFPPLTMQPPAVGGVPPQGEDFNGAMNQVARVAWWVLNGGGWPYDATFATNSNIGGYPNGAVLQSADFLGQWISTADNNQVNPDTVGTNWVPGFQYGSTALTGQTGGTTTLTPLQAAKRGITVSGTLTSALVLIFPTWVKDWSITNNTTGAFTVIAKTAAGSGVTIPQNGSPTAVAGDGTNITQNPQNIANGSASTHAVAVGQLFGGLKGIASFKGVGTYTFTVPTGVAAIYASGTAPGGGGGSGGPGSVSSTSAWSAGGGGGGAGQPLLRQAYTVVPGSSITITIGAVGVGGAGGATNPGNPAGNLTISGAGFNGGTTVTLTGGGGGSGGTAVTSGAAIGGNGGSGFNTGAAGQDCTQNNATGAGGAGGGNMFGAGAAGARASTSGVAGQTVATGVFGGGGGGGSGVYTAGGGNGGSGGTGGQGCMFFEW